MHTEEETFNQLRRVPYRNMLRLILPQTRIGQCVATRGRELGLLAPNGWTYTDFVDEFSKDGNQEIFSSEVARSYRPEEFT